MAFVGVINYPIMELGLSQIYLNEKKIKAIEKWFNPSDMVRFEPLTVHDYGNGKYTLTDGHSRAYVAYVNGLTAIPIVYDNDEIVAGEIGQELYRTDIEWCNRFSIYNISHLKQRIISNEDYQRLWIERCDRSYNLLVQTTVEEREFIQSKKPKLFLYGASDDLSEFYFENSDGESVVYKTQHRYFD
ncbi:MAG: hypothetical protein PUE61_09705 [Clostridiales bacterium]|nr:hypothetical protein [Clostridiales bacterium]